MSLSVASTALAENFITRPFTRFWNMYQRNNAWPETFIPADRAAARAPFAICVANGWRAQNTLSEFYFDDATKTLNEAGDLKVKAVLTATPPAYRTVFVLRGSSPDETAARIAAVQAAVAKYAAPGEFAPVVETTIEPHGAPAEYIVDVERAFRESAPEPRLNTTPATSGSGSSSSSGS